MTKEELLKNFEEEFKTFFSEILNKYNIKIDEQKATDNYSLEHDFYSLMEQAEEHIKSILEYQEQEEV